MMMNTKRNIRTVLKRAALAMMLGGVALPAMAETLGDTLVNFAGSPVQSHDDLLALLAGDMVGTAVPAKFVRGGQVHSTEITVAARS